MVWILTDAMDRFQGVFKSAQDAKDRLYIKHGNSIEYKEDVDGTIKATCSEGQEYTIKAHTPQ